ncbi:DUF4386 domain-containing protein [Catellatospora citrea]|uniref:DUF4386 domain-containing protein n=1 Tax=Catellatospora citrea TaxID=53366 RepID=A0A8J3NXV7_9ACTN|nr:DUF4386 domain-containing protein [Catellatospora citrea]RKE05504.1 hypothetical protein C8E86_0304 [Catellatospora citrea]GIF96850.1 hypothetical protein Cci01nite_19440 [Catellatospora citrea]
MTAAPPGPPPIIPASAFAGLTIAGIALSTNTPRPDVSDAAVLAYLGEHAAQARLAAFLTVAAAAPLAIWTTTVYQRMRALGSTAPGSTIALIGGALASAMAVLCGFVGWAGARLGDDPGAASVAGLQRDLAFATGGPGFVMFFGLLIAGVSVPMLLLGIRRPLAIFGLVIALAAELSTVVLLTLDAAPTLPIARFGGLVWLILVSLLLPARRPARPERASTMAGVA